MAKTDATPVTGFKEALMSIQTEMEKSMSCLTEMNNAIQYVKSAIQELHAIESSPELSFLATLSRHKLSVAHDYFEKYDLEQKVRTHAEIALGKETASKLTDADYDSIIVAFSVECEPEEPEDEIWDRVIKAYLYEGM